MASITLANVRKTLGGRTILNGISLKVEQGEFFSVLGPSGCGKSTLLRIVAGFLPPDEGTILFDGEDVRCVPPQRRRVGMVFQQYALWPHMSVRENLAFGLEVQGVPPKIRGERIERVLRLARLEPHSERAPGELSGGEQQRVALARALVLEPRVLLLDEPLSNLDAKLRGEMRCYIRSLHDEFHTSTIYVTHDQEEALSMADRIAVLRDGSLCQVGRPREVYENPSNEFVASFVGEANFFEGVVTETVPQLTVRLHSGELLKAPRGESIRQGSNVWCAIRPERITVAASQEPLHENCLQGVVVQRSFLGSVEEYRVRLRDEGEVRARASSTKALVLSPGGNVLLLFRASDVMVFPAR